MKDVTTWAQKHFMKLFVNIKAYLAKMNSDEKKQGL